MYKSYVHNMPLKEKGRQWRVPNGGKLNSLTMCACWFGGLHQPWHECSELTHTHTHTHKHTHTQTHTHTHTHTHHHSNSHPHTHTDTHRHTPTPWDPAPVFNPCPHSADFWPGQSS